jgi:hypothetical protein
MPSDVLLVVLIPVFDDWTALSLLLPRLTQVLPTLGPRWVCSSSTMGRSSRRATP